MIGHLAIILASIEGTYEVSGYDDPSTKKWYNGTAQITEHGDIYHVTWDLISEGKEYRDIGTGLKSDKQLSVIFKSSPDQEDQYDGVEVLKIKGDTLEGNFVLFGDRKIGYEKLKKTN